MLPYLLLLALVVPAVQLDSALARVPLRPTAAAAVHAVRTTGPISIDGTTISSPPARPRSH